MRDMDTLIGPVLARAGLFAFDSWTPAAGLRQGFGYRRIEDAYYARKAELTSGAIPCNTLDAFYAQMRNAPSRLALAA
jgi:hypothetical protein